MPNAKLYERFTVGGAGALLDHELVSYVLSAVFPHRATEPLAEALLLRFGGIAGLMSADIDAVASQAGVGMAGAAMITVLQTMHLRRLKQKIGQGPVLLSWDALLKYLAVDMGFLSVERVRVLHLNSRGVLIRDQILSEGSVSEAVVYTREVLRKAIALGASKLILVHNHPSGDPSPSSQDIQLTRKLIVAAQALDIEVFDHVIIAGLLSTSFRSLRLM